MVQSAQPMGISPKGHTSLQGCGAATTEGGELMTQLKGPRLESAKHGHLGSWKVGQAEHTDFGSSQIMENSESSLYTEWGNSLVIQRCLRKA